MHRNFRKRNGYLIVLCSKDSHMVDHYVGVFDLLEQCRKIQGQWNFPQTFTLRNILRAIPVGNATVERSFRQMKMAKTMLRNLLSDCNLAWPLNITAEGQEPSSVPFQEILDVLRKVTGV